MARRKKKRKSRIGSFLSILVVSAILALGLARHYFPQESAIVESKIEQLLNGILPSKGGIYATDEFTAQNYFPKSEKNLQILDNIGYTSGFSNKDAIPLWVAYKLKTPFEYNTSKRPSSFSQDPRAPGSPKHSDYSNSGYDRGHMAPNYAIGRCYGQAAQTQTFLLTNIVPQRGNMNRGIWREMEQHIAEVAAPRFGAILVFVGPILEENPAKIKGKISVPAACYAILAAKRGDDIFAAGFIVPQNPQKKSIWDYCVPIDEIEKLTGIDFLSQLPDSIEDKLEALANPNPFK